MKANLDSRKKSMVETLTDVFLGFLIATALNFTVLPMYVKEIENMEVISMLEIGAFYTVFGIIRRYGTRRLFERLRVSV